MNAALPQGARFGVVGRRSAALAALVAGPALAIAGWFVDRADFFRVVAAVVAPGETAALETLAFLEKSDPPAQVPLTDPGAGFLFEHWPSPVVLTPEVRSRVVAIGRGSGMKQISPTKEAFVVELYLAVDQQHHIANPEFLWSLFPARDFMLERLRSRTTSWGFSLFALGLLLSTATGIREWIKGGQSVAPDAPLAHVDAPTDALTPPPSDAE